MYISKIENILKPKSTIDKVNFQGIPSGRLRKGTLRLSTIGLEFPVLSYNTMPTSLEEIMARKLF